MELKKLDCNERNRKLAWLDRLEAKQPYDCNRAAQAPPEIRDAFDPSLPEGRLFYESLWDEELLDRLRAAAKRLGRSPAQKEMFWVTLSYLRLRFQKWPYALVRANLSKSAGSGGVSLERQAEEQKRAEALLESVREKARELGRIPHPSDLPDVCAALRKRYRRWGDVLNAAGVCPYQSQHIITDFADETRALLEQVRQTAYRLGRVPLRSEVDEPVRSALTARCGSWRNALFQIGFEPVAHLRPFSGSGLEGRKDAGRKRHSKSLQDCTYQVLNLSDETKQELEQLRSLAKALGRAPRRDEVPPGVRKHLQSACGSFANALYQIGLAPDQTVPNQQKEGLPRVILDKK